MEQQKRITVEDIMGEAGFRVRWSAMDHWADVEVFEVVWVSEEPGFARKGWVNLPDDVTTNIDEAEPYLAGFIKWDGCTELDIGKPHWCGPEGYQKHIDLLKYLYHRAFELMGREPWKLWETTTNNLTSNS